MQDNYRKKHRPVQVQTMPIIIAFFFVTLAHSEEIKVRYGLFNYSLNHQENKIVLTGNDIDLSLTKSACNRALFTDFSRELKAVTQRMSVQKTKNESAVEIKTDKVTSYSSKTSAEGRYFLKLPDYFRKLKIREKLKCPI